jgi:hypothetical protein
MGETVETPPWGFGAASTTIHRPARGVGFGGITCTQTQGELQVSPPLLRGRLWRHHNFIMPHPVCNYVHKIMLQFYISFCVFISHMVSYFSLSRLWFELCNPIAGGSA